MDEVTHFYAVAREELGKKLSKHKGAWPDWTQDIVQIAVTAGWAATKAGVRDTEGVVRRAVKREFEKELRYQERFSP